MDLKKKVFKIGKHEIAQWQVYLGIIASIIGIISFFRKPKTTAAETPYSINPTTSDSGGAGSSGSVDPVFGTGNDMNSQLTDTISQLNTTVSDLQGIVISQGGTIEGLNSKIDSNNSALIGMNGIIAGLKAPVIVPETSAPIVTIVPSVAPSNHDTSGVIATGGDGKILTAPVVIGTAATNGFSAPVTVSPTTNTPVVQITPTISVEATTPKNFIPTISENVDVRSTKPQIVVE